MQSALKPGPYRLATSKFSIEAVNFAGQPEKIQGEYATLVPELEVLTRASYQEEGYITCRVDLDRCHAFKQLRYSDRRPETYLHLTGSTRQI